MKLVIPGNPVPKGRPRFGNGHVYTPQRTRDHETLIRQYALVARLKPISGPVRLTARFYTDKALDGDNALKLLADALQPPRGIPAGVGNAYFDDKQVRKAEYEVIFTASDPRTEVEIEPWEGA